MNKKVIIYSIALLFVFSLLFFPVEARADYHVKKIKHTDAFSMMGQTQPAKDEEGATWLGKDKMREDEGTSKSIIIRFDLKKIFVVDHAEKTYTEIDLPVDFDKILPAQAKQMMQMMEVKATVTKTEETLKIKEWDCTKYLVEIAMTMMGMEMPMTMEMWCTKDLGIDLAMYKEFTTEMLSLQPMFKNFADEFKKIDGYPVKTEMTMKMMGQESKSREEVISVEKMDAPPGTYDLPQGYTKTETYNPFEQQR